MTAPFSSCAPAAMPGIDRLIASSLVAFVFTASFSIFLSNFFLYLSLTAYVIQYATKRAPFRFDRIYTLMLIFVFANIFALFNGGPGLAGIGKVKNVMCFLAFVVAFEKAGRLLDRFKMLLLLQSANAILLVLAILSHSAGLSDYYIFCDFANWTNQYSGLFSISLTYAGFLVMMQCVSLSVLLGAPAESASRFSRGTFAGLMAVNFVSLALTYARGAWLAMALMAFVIVSIRAGRRAAFGMALAALAAAVFVVSSLGAKVPFVSDLNRRIVMTFEGDSSGRDVIYRVGWRMIADRPLLGVGIGGVERLYPSYIAAADFLPDIRKKIILEQKVVYGHLHNLYMQIWAECGLFGIVSFLGLIAYAMSVLWRAARDLLERECPGLETSFAAGVFAAFLAMCLMGLTEYNFFHNEVSRILWFYTGMAFHSIYGASAARM